MGGVLVLPPPETVAGNTPLCGDTRGRSESVEPQVPSNNAPGAVKGCFHPYISRTALHTASQALLNEMVLINSRVVLHALCMLF